MKQRTHYQQILHLVSRIGRLVNPQHLPVLKRRGISQAQFLALDAMGEADTPMRMSALAQASGLAQSELSRVVDALEDKRWVERIADPLDGRARLVRMTATGERLIQRTYEQAASELASVWSDFTHDEWHRLIDQLARFERGLRRIRPGGPGRAPRTAKERDHG